LICSLFLFRSISGSASRLWHGGNRTVVDRYIRECLTLHAHAALCGEKVAAALIKIVIGRGVPKSITVDNGTEFGSKAMGHWACSNQLHLNFIRPGRQVENGYIESFNGRLRDECLNVEAFFSLVDARRKLALWLHDSTTNIGLTRHCAQGAVCLSLGWAIGTASPMMLSSFSVGARVGLLLRFGASAPYNSSLHQSLIAAGAISGLCNFTHNQGISWFSLVSVLL